MSSNFSSGVMGFGAEKRGWEGWVEERLRVKRMQQRRPWYQRQTEGKEGGQEAVLVKKMC